MPLAPGSKGHAQLLVGPEHLASHLIQVPEDDFPHVFATAQMIALMELAASRAMLSVLAEGELSVGVTVDITHRAATLAGDTVTATARFTGMNEKFYCFQIIAQDSGGEIGRGNHTRAVVSKERLINGANKRRAAK
jgi:fluoroacetyl-CoA thioesterase